MSIERLRIDLAFVIAPQFRRRNSGSCAAIGIAGSQLSAQAEALMDPLRIKLVRVTRPRIAKIEHLRLALKEA
jgi:hypothetical protein